jgi:hypothetical protein
MGKKIKDQLHGIVARQRAEQSPAGESPATKTGSVKQEMKEFGINLHHFVVDWQIPEVILPKIDLINS